MDYFTTTLSISPLKNAEKLNAIGDALAEEYGDGMAAFGLQEERRLQALGGAFRGNTGCTGKYYCGCVFSKRERDSGSLLAQSEA